VDYTVLLRRIARLSSIFVGSLAMLGIITPTCSAGGQKPPPAVAVVQQVHNGQPVGPAIPLPDCRSCTVTTNQNGTKTLHIPERVKEEMGRQQ
jgi:hypothetical protein